MVRWKPGGASGIHSGFGSFRVPKQNPAASAARTVFHSWWVAKSSINGLWRPSSPPTLEAPRHRPEGTSVVSDREEAPCLPCRVGKASELDALDAQLASPNGAAVLALTAAE